MVTVQGIVTKMSLVQPKISTSVHYCEATKRGSIKNYNDVANLQQLGSSNGMMSEANNAFRMSDENGNPLTTEYGFCVYKDYQTITIQEMPERAPTGQLPRAIQVILENDLVDKVKPGDRIEVTGVYRCIPNSGGITTGVFRPMLVAIGI